MKVKASCCLQECCANLFGGGKTLGAKRQERSCCEAGCGGLKQGCGSFEVRSALPRGSGSTVKPVTVSSYWLQLLLH